MPRTAKITARPRMAPKRPTRLRKLRLEDLEGDGLWDSIKSAASKVISTAKSALKPSDKLNNSSKKTLEENADGVIAKMDVFRTPVKQVLMKVFDVIAAGKFSTLAKQNGYERFYHLGLLLELRMPDGSMRKVVVEKNHVLNIVTSLSALTNETQYMDVPLRGKSISLKDLVQNTEKAVGPERFYTYDWKDRNCQRFVMDVLESNGLLDDKLKNFVWQDVQKLGEQLPEFTRWAARGVTDLAAAADRIMGNGKVPIRLRKIEGGQLYHVYSHGGARITKHGLPLPVIKRALKTK